MSRKITKLELEERIKQRFPEEKFEIIKFDGMGKEGQFKCLGCNEIIKVNKAANFLAPSKAYGCKNCHGLWKEREKKIELIKEKYDILYTYVKESHTYYHVRCKKCQHERDTTLKNLIVHLDCGCQTNTYRNRTEQEFINEVNKNSSLGDYELVGKYINQTTKTLVRHKSCGFIWKVRPSEIIHGKSSCPKCRKNKSIGESLVEKILSDLGIIFEIEKYIPDTRQRFDFYFEYNGVKCAIEYNGIQHYKEVDYFTASLAEVQERDNRKRKYCKDNCIKLLEIPYFKDKDEIKQDIIEFLNKLNDYPVREQG